MINSAENDQSTISLILRLMGYSADHVQDILSSYNTGNCQLYIEDGELMIKWSNSRPYRFSETIRNPKDYRIYKFEKDPVITQSPLGLRSP
jgi:hypothetical protein